MRLLVVAVDEDLGTVEDSAAQGQISQRPPRLSRIGVWQWPWPPPPAEEEGELPIPPLNAPRIVFAEATLDAQTIFASQLDPGIRFKAMMDATVIAEAKLL
jgi:hypothetical protein